MRPLLSLSLAWELEGAAGSNKSQLHIMRTPAPMHTPVPTHTPLHPHQLAALAGLSAPPMPRAERAAQGRGRRAPLPTAVQRTRPNHVLALEQ